MSVEYLELAGELYQEFDQNIGVRSTNEERLKRAYHPVLERRKVVSEWQEHGEKSPFISKIRQGIERNLISTLAERYHVQGGSTIMEFKDGQLWPDEGLEPFIETARRGAALRRILKTPDEQREVGEILGWKKITEILSNEETPPGTKLFSLSPPSTSAGSPYGERYLDEFTLIKETAVRKVRCRRTSMNFCLEDYEAFALEADPEYFDHHKDEPIDAYFLAHPFISSQEIPKSRIVGFPPQEFEKIVTVCSSLIDSHVDSLFVPNIDWRRVVRTLNITFDQADRIYNQLQSNPRNNITGYSGTLSVGPSYDRPNQTISLVSGGCGTSGGFKFGIKNLLANSVAQFSPEVNNEYPYIGKCQICKVDPTRVGKCSICKSCVEIHFS